MPDPIGVHPKSQLEKRIDDLEGRCGGGGGVGEYLDDGHTCERFNDYREHIYNEITQKWVGGNWSDKAYDHIEGYGNKIIDPYGSRFSSGYNHAEGFQNYIDGTGETYHHVEGYGNRIIKNVPEYGSPSSGQATHVGGFDNTVQRGSFSFVHGRGNSVKECDRVAVIGSDNNVMYSYGAIVAGVANDVNVHAGAVFGDGNKCRKSYSLVSGLNADDEGIYMLAIGNGHSGNIMTLDGLGNLTIKGHYNNSGADYAEYFEWLDGNPDAEDRCGMLVTLDGDKLIPAHGDEIFGIISAAPSVAGNAFELHWHGKYARDIYGRAIKSPDGEPLISPDFDPGREYIPRSKRPEWAAVGLTGRMVINDDGSCKVGGFVSARRGVGTSCFKNTGIRVLRRINERHVEVIIR